MFWMRNEDNSFPIGTLISRPVSLSRNTSCLVSLDKLGIYGPRRQKTCLQGVCKQHRRRPACASAQSDQRLCFLESIVCKLATGEISTF